MNVEQAKAKLAEINRSTATKHPKVLVGELCGIIGFLLNEIERLNTTAVTVIRPEPELKPNWTATAPTQRPPTRFGDTDLRNNNSPLKDDKNKNAGDAE
jgi:hypothetical protein